MIVEIVVYWILHILKTIHLMILYQILPVLLHCSISNQKNLRTLQNYKTHSFECLFFKILIFNQKHDFCHWQVFSFFLLKWHIIFVSEKKNFKKYPGPNKPNFLAVMLLEEKVIGSSHTANYSTSVFFFSGSILLWCAT